MKYEGSCHCGNVAFEVEGEFDSGLDCNCSMCRRRGGLLAFVPRENLVLTLLGALAGIPMGIWLHSFVMGQLR